MADASFAACAQGRGLLEGGRPRSPVPSEIRGRGGEGMRSQIWSVSEFQMFWSESWAVRKAQEGLRMVGDAVIDLTAQMEGSFGEGANCNGNSSSCFCFFGFFPLHSQPQEASIIVLFLNPNPRKSSALVATVLNDIHSEGTSHHSSCLLKMLNVRRVTILSTILGYLLIIMCLSLFFLINCVQWYQ